MITTKIKDKVLNHLVENAKDCSITINNKKLSSQLEVGVQVPALILDFFTRQGLIHITPIADNGTNLVALLVPAYDLYHAGGYEFKDDVAALELEKLVIEVKAIKGDIDKRPFDIIMTSIATLASIWGLHQQK